MDSLRKPAKPSSNQPTSRLQQVWIGALKDTSLPLRIKDSAVHAGLSHPLVLWRDSTSAKLVSWCLTTTSKPTTESTQKPAIPTRPETALAVSRLPTSELPLLVTRFLDPVMRLPLLMLLPPSVPLLLPSMLLICLSSSTIQVSTLRGTAEMVTTTWTTQFWP